MWNEPGKTRLERIPGLYETEDTPLKDKLIHLHFFLGGCDWYIAEFDGVDLFWGFAILNNDLEMAEWGYISFQELKEIKTGQGIEVDCELARYWKVKKASEIERIREAMGWNDEKDSSDDKADDDAGHPTRPGSRPGAESETSVPENSRPYLN